MLNDSKARCSSGNVKKKRNSPKQQHSNSWKSQTNSQFVCETFRARAISLWCALCARALPWFFSISVLLGDDFGIQTFCKSNVFYGQNGCQGDWLPHSLAVARYHDWMIIFMLLNSSIFFFTGINSKWMCVCVCANRGSKQITAFFTFFTDFRRKITFADGLKALRRQSELEWGRVVWMRVVNLLSQCQFARFAMNFLTILLFKLWVESIKSATSLQRVNLLTNWYCYAIQAQPYEVQQTP